MTADKLAISTLYSISANFAIFANFLMKLEKLNSHLKFPLLSRPAPGRNFTCFSDLHGYERGRDRGYCKYY